MEFARQKQFKYNADATPMAWMLFISADILDPFWKLPSFRKWDKEMDINPEKAAFDTTQYKEKFW